MAGPFLMLSLSISRAYAKDEYKFVKHTRRRSDHACDASSPQG